MAKRTVFPLPRELRNRIYELAAAPTPIDIETQRVDASSYTLRSYEQSLSILAVNKTTRIEAKDTVARTQTFVLVSFYDDMLASSVSLFATRWISNAMHRAELFRGQNYHSMRVDIKLPREDGRKNKGDTLQYLILLAEDLSDFCRALQWQLYAQTGDIRGSMQNIDAHTLALPSNAEVDKTIKIELIPRAGKPITSKMEQTLLQPLRDCIGVNQKVIVAGARHAIASTFVQRLCPIQPKLDAIAWTMLEAVNSLCAKINQMASRQEDRDLLEFYEMAHSDWILGVLNAIPENVYDSKWTGPLVRANIILLDLAAVAMSCHLRLYDPLSTLQWYNHYVEALYDFCSCLRVSNAGGVLCWSSLGQNASLRHPELDRLWISARLCVDLEHVDLGDRGRLDKYIQVLGGAAAARPGSKHIAHDYEHLEMIRRSAVAISKFLSGSMAAEDVEGNLSFRQLGKEPITKAAAAYEYTMPANIAGWEKK